MCDETTGSSIERSTHRTPRLPLLFSLVALAAAYALVQPAPLRGEEDPGEGPAVPTRLVVRVVAHDAKLLGDGVGGARVVVRDADTGELLAEGLQQGTTGDTDAIMRRPRERGAAVYGTEGAAAFRATLTLRRPTRVEITAHGPLEPPHVTLRASRRMWLLPGRHVEGEGVVLELYGFIVEVLAPEAGAVPVPGDPLEVRARVTMLCSCPTEPGGLWDADAIAVEARLLGPDGSVSAAAPLSFTGETSTWAGSLAVPPDAARLQVTAAAVGGANAGVAEVPLAPSREDLDGYLEAWAANHDFAGVVLVAHGDRLYRRASGDAHAELGVAHVLDGRFFIGSLSKTFTAALAVVLARRGVLSLDAPLAVLLPAFPRAERLTLRHLLMHASGVADPDYAALAGTRPRLSEVVASIAARPPHFEPGAGNRYSSGGYVLIAAAIEAATGRPFAAVLRSEILDPLGLDHTEAASAGTVLPGLATGYAPGPPPLFLATAEPFEVGAAVGSGNVVSTAPDLLAWGRALRSGRPFDVEELPYPYGWGVRDYFGGPLLEQTGLVPGYGSALAVHFEEPLVVVCLSNVATPFFNLCSRDLAAIVLGREVEAPAPRRPAAVPLAEQRRWEGTYRAEDDGPELVVVERAGALWVRFDGTAPGHYLEPLASDRYLVRAEQAEVELSRSGNRVLQTWTWPGGGSRTWTRSDATGPAEPEPQGATP